MKMSSTAPVRRGSFFRSSSLDKLRCTASFMYPLQLAGIKFTRESQKFFSEKSIILRSRTQLYRSYLSTSNAVSDIMCSVLVWMLDVLAKLSVINLNISKEIQNKYKLKQKKLILTRQRQSNYNNNIINSNNINLILNRNLNKNNDINNNNIITTIIKPKIIDDEQNLELDKLFDENNNINNEKLLSQSLNNFGIQNNLKQNIRSRRSLTLTTIVYGIFLAIYIQLYLLCHLLFVTKTVPPGLIFMLFNLTIIASIILQVSFIQPKPKQNNKERASRKLKSN